MRRGALPELKYGDLKWIEKYQIYEIRVYAGFPEEYTSYCSIECAAALNSYLDFRRNYGEVITDDSYLIRKQFNTRNHKGKIKVSYATDPPQKHKISNKNIEKMLYHLLYDSGIRNYMSHAYRKFFENKCLESGVDPFYVSVLMGHKAGIGVERSYYRPDSIQGEYSLLELYVKKAMPYLTISDESRLKLKNRELEIRLKEESSRFDSLQEQINQIMAANKKYGL
jgi:integrase